MKIEKSQIQEIEFLFSQSAKGLHLLFDDTRKLADILKTPIREKQFFSSENMRHVESLFKDLVAAKSVERKKAYLRGLSEKNFKIVVRAYFHIVDNTAARAGGKTVH